MTTDDQVYREANRWIVKLMDTEHPYPRWSAQERQRLSDWMLLSELHVQAFLVSAMAWEILGAHCARLPVSMNALYSRFKRQMAKLLESGAVAARN